MQPHWRIWVATIILQIITVLPTLSNVQQKLAHILWDIQYLRGHSCRMLTFLQDPPCHTLPRHAGMTNSLGRRNDVIMGTMASQITSLTIVYSAVYSDANERKDQSSASLAFVKGIHRWPLNSSHKMPVTRKMVPFDDVIMFTLRPQSLIQHNRHSQKYRCVSRRILMNG